jgi:hypothetical protein
MWLLAGCGWGSGELAPVEADERVALTAGAVAPLSMMQAVVDPARETWGIDRAPNGAWTLDYGYSDDKLIVEGSWVLEPTPGDASWIYDVGYALAKTSWNGAQGIELVDAPGLLAWGDETDCALARAFQTDLGFVCRGRHQRRAFMVKVFGVQPNGEAAPGRLLQGPLAAFEAWDPESLHPR